MTVERHEYDEQAVLTNYVWLSYRHLLTTDEELADNAFSLEAKFAGSTEFGGKPSSKMLELRKRYENSAYVQEALRRGYGAFQAIVRNRIVEESPESFFVNRCPDCKRILATPKAMQCLWCGKDWHASE